MANKRDSASVAHVSTPGEAQSFQDVGATRCALEGGRQCLISRFRKRELSQWRGITRHIQFKFCDHILPGFRLGRVGRSADSDRKTWVPSRFRRWIVIDGFH